MGGHEACGPPYQVPDYRIYKLEDAPQVQQVQKALKSHGLSDPWARNEVWRYNEKVYGAVNRRTRVLFFRGFGKGLILAVLTAIGSTYYNRKTAGKHGDEEHH